MLVAGLLIGAAGTLTPSVQAAGPGRAQWATSVVRVEVTLQRYDYLQPWARQTARTVKNGVVIGHREILTTAEGLEDRTLIRLQKNGRGLWSNGKVQWIDYHANLAVITSDEESFWEGLQAVGFAPPSEEGSRYQIVSWDSTNLEIRAAEWGRHKVGTGRLSSVAHLQLEFSSDAKGLNSSEVLAEDGLIAGLCMGQSGDYGVALPASFIQEILRERARAEGSYRGLGLFSFTWQPSTNPDLHRALGLKGRARGVVVIASSKDAGKEAVLARDIILEVDGHPIDLQGDYEDPRYGNLMLENLSTQGDRWAGDVVPIKVWREGAEKVVHYRLPPASFNSQLVPERELETAPEYLIVGGFILQPLTREYLSRWGGDWRRRAPFRLVHFSDASRTPERSALLVLSYVLPDPVNLGYQDDRYLTLEKVNGKVVQTLEDVIEALKTPDGDFQVFDFTEGGAVNRMVLEAKMLEEANRRILSNYGIPADRHLESLPTTGKKDAR